MLKTLTVSLVAILLLVGCSNAAVGPESPAAQNQGGSSVGGTRTAVTIAQFGHVFLYMPLYVAVNKGFFEKHGLQVKLVSTGGDEKTFTAVATGNAQFGVSDPTFTAIAREHGQGGKVVAAVVRGVPFWVVALKPGIKPFSKPEGLNGYRCAAFTAPSTSYAVMKKILADGHAEKAQIIQGAFGTLPSLLKSGQADVAIEIEPTVSLIAADGGRVVYTPKLGDFAFTGLEVSDSFAKEHPEQIKACVAALNDAMQYIQSDFAGAVEVAQKEFPDIKPAVVKDALARLKDSGTIPANPYLPKEAWKAAIGLRHELRDLKSAGTYEENVDMSYVPTHN